MVDILSSMKKENPQNKRFANGGIWLTQKEADNLLIVLLSILAFIIIFL